MRQRHMQKSVSPLLPIFLCLSSVSSFILKITKILLFSSSSPCKKRPTHAKQARYNQETQQVHPIEIDPPMARPDPKDRNECFAPVDSSRNAEKTDTNRQYARFGIYSWRRIKWWCGRTHLCIQGAFPVVNPDVLFRCRAFHGAWVLTSWM